MTYFVTFLEGVMSFISPCVLPLIPVYISYFAGASGEKRRALRNALFFVLGFTFVFCLLGVFAVSLGRILSRSRGLVDLICGLIIILFGLSYLEIIRIPFFKGMEGGRQVSGVLSAFVFGMIYSVNLGPCVGPFLGAALTMASRSETALQGLLLLLLYSLGLGLPFLLSAVLLDRLRSTFAWIKRHYRPIKIICGLFLILTGVLMALGKLELLMRSLM